MLVARQGGTRASRLRGTPARTNTSSILKTPRANPFPNRQACCHGADAPRPADDSCQHYSILFSSRTCSGGQVLGHPDHACVRWARVALEERWWPVHTTDTCFTPIEPPSATSTARTSHGDHEGVD